MIEPDQFPGNPDEFFLQIFVYKCKWTKFKNFQS